MPRRDRIPETFAAWFVICPDLEPYDSAVTYANGGVFRGPLSRIDSAASASASGQPITQQPGNEENTSDKVYRQASH